MPPLRFVVVGAGSISREFALQHLRGAAGTVVSVVDVDVSRAAELAADVGALHAGANLRGRGYHARAGARVGAPVEHGTMLGPYLASCDAVYIGTPPSSHAALACTALEHGKHVLLEKPLAASADDANTIVGVSEEAAGHGVFLGLNIGMRWNPALLELRRLAIVEGTLGSLRSARLSLHFAQWPRAWQVQPWCASREQGGPLREVGTHFLFALHQLFGHGCVSRVRCTVMYTDGEDGVAAESAAEGTLEMHTGFQVHLSVRTHGTGLSAADGSDHCELEVEGERGALLLDAFTSLWRTQPAREVIIRDGTYGRKESVQALVDAVDRGSIDGSSIITAREGRNAQRVLDALLASGGGWVDVRYDDASGYNV